MKGKVLPALTRKNRHRWKVPFSILAVTAFIGTSGFTFVPDIDQSNHKNMPTYGNARLNDAKVTPTEMIPRPRLSDSLMKHVDSVHYAVVIQRQNQLYVGVEPKNPKLTRIALDRAKDWLAHHVQSHVQIYVSTDATLVNHFHRFAADRASHLNVGSDVILADIERVFPDTNK